MAADPRFRALGLRSRKEQSLVLVILTIVATALVVLSSGRPAVATPPVLLGVSHQGGHLTAAWSLPPGVRSGVIEAATSPNVASDGSFFSENVELFDVLNDFQTSYLSGSGLQPGVYFVHVSGYDTSCTPCPITEWSQTQTILIPNQPPTIAWRRASLSASPYSAFLSLRLSVCDDSTGEGRILVKQRRIVGGKTVARGRYTETVYQIGYECGVEYASNALRGRFFGPGRFVVTVRVVDAQGAYSNKLRRSWPAPG